MSRWTFEPGHTAAEFCARHMMVTYVRGHFKDVHGTLEFNLKDPAGSSVVVVIDTRKLWTGEPARDAHLRSADSRRGDFRDNFPRQSGRCDRRGRLPRRELTIRGVTRPVTLEVQYLGNGKRPGGKTVDKGPKTRAASWPRPRSAGRSSG